MLRTYSRQHDTETARRMLNEMLEAPGHTVSGVGMSSIPSMEVSVKNSAGRIVMIIRQRWDEPDTWTVEKFKPGA